VWDRARSW